MNRPNLFLYLIIICTIAFMSSCDKEKTQAKDQQELEQLFNQIKGIAESSTCGQNQELKYIAIGAKACGGPTSYLGYSSSINVSEFENMVAKYTEMQQNYNKKWNVISDCMALAPPKSVTCENGKPKLVY
ncbi:MAG: hypothetical protein REI64_00130 [Pedobacter sp.]|uniref:hypothetical protein n=1 Tax=Pedobacter sp. TaxID=1411316 RepID=UPI002808489A|nr:hypothetical protein [Pedobacter sp.]MDQ8003167.1 hypothetical protein [Pedobacter sp.]